MRVLRFLILAFALSGVTGAASSDDNDAVFLVANPKFRDPTYRHTVLLAVALEKGGHIGLIVNRPTNQPLTDLFPEHEPSKKVVDPVYFGGPFSRSALVAVVKRDSSPGRGSVALMNRLYMAINASTIDRIIESTPNEARYYVGYVVWRPGELRSEIDRGLWAVQNADPEVVLRKDTTGLWEELLRRSRRITASTPVPEVPDPTGLL